MQPLQPGKHMLWMGCARLPNTPGRVLLRGVGVTLTVPETGIIGVTGVVSVFHRQAACPLQPAGFFGHPWQPVPGDHEAESLSGGLSGGQQASLAVVYQWNGHRGDSTGPPTGPGG